MKKKTVFLIVLLVPFAWLVALVVIYVRKTGALPKPDQLKQQVTGQISDLSEKIKQFKKEA